MNKKLTAVLTAMTIFTGTAFASVIGTEVLSEKSYEISDGTVLFEREVLSDQKGVGQQSEFYAKYTPNTSTVPVVVSGATLFGKKTAPEIAKYMQEQGLRPMLGINAAYFSLQTGVTMGHLISDGRVQSKDTTALQGVGFTKTGEGFIAPLKIDVNISCEQGDVPADNVNKYNGAALACVSLYTPDYGESFWNEAEATTVIVDVGENTLKIGESFSATVKSRENKTGDVPLGKGEMVLVVNNEGSYEYHYNLLNSLAEGDEITISISAEDERWLAAEEGLASVGETLITNGEIVCDKTNGAAPRTAVGITADGEVVFYVIDGRQAGYSYGVQLRSLAKRMAELGCVEAINLDGGGSTSISGVYPGAENIAVLNKPSDGRPRGVSNFIFLKNTNEPTGILKSIYTTPHNEKYLSGTSAELTSVGVDTAYHRLALTDVEYSADGESVIEGNMATFKGNGTVKITSKSGGVETVSEHFVYDTPSIVVKADGKKVTALSIPSEMTMKITAEAFDQNSRLKADSSLFGFAVEGDIGTLEDGVFTAKADKTTEGAIIVTAGKSSVRIPVTVQNDSNLFGDISEHWARPMIEAISEMGAINGYETEGGKIFMPDSSITRAEFAVMLSGYLKLDRDGYGEEDIFDDVIPDWARASINALYSLGLVSGKTGENGEILYAPSDKITRSEVAAIIGRAMQHLDAEAELAFSDTAQIPDWAKGFVARLVFAGVLTGYEDNTVRPLSDVTRAEAATILYKLSAIK